MNNDQIQQEKRTVGILFGGKSAEHEISVLSAKNVLAALDSSLFRPMLIGIDKQGGWHSVNNPDDLATILPKPNHIDISLLNRIDVIFPILHGPFGEDGTLQGLLELAGVSYVGCGVLSSAVNMDKDVTKRLLRVAGLTVADWIVVLESKRPSLNPVKIVKTLGLPLFIKPANMGSSIGVSKVEHEHDLLAAVDQALQYDRKVLIEKAVVGDEIECAVLGNEVPKASALGRILPSADFYTYDAKYHDEDNTVLEIPAHLSESTSQQVKSIALQAFKVLGCEGLSRVDMFVTAQGEVYINEINTIPGFTKFSMYPQLWAAVGTSYTDLITQLIHLAIERYTARQRLLTTIA